MDEGASVCWVPDSLLLHIFKNLQAKHLLNAGQVCKRWYIVSLDELLWKDLFYRNFHISRNVGMAPGKFSWYSEYKRLYYRTPLIQTEVLKAHTDQVLHVSFSRNGKYFATSSKDGFVKLWNAVTPSTVKYSQDMKTFCWKYTQFSQFNESDTKLLVSGVYFGSHSTSGEIAVFSIEEGELVLQCRVINRPYDIFGTWYNDEYLFSGNLHWMGHLVSCSALWINRASQVTESEWECVVKRVYKFCNVNASSIRTVMVATPSQFSTSDVDVTEEDLTEQATAEKACSNKVRLKETRVFVNGMYRTRLVPEDVSTNNSLRESRSTSQLSAKIEYDEHYRNAESRLSYTLDEEEESTALTSDAAATFSTAESSSSLQTGSIDFESEDDLDEPPFRRFSGELQLLDQRDKLLIFTTGSKTYTPHQIGIKVIQNLAMEKTHAARPPRLTDLGVRMLPNDGEEHGGHHLPGNFDLENLEQSFDDIDYLIDLNGHIIGMGLSPDNRFLYVNVRPWPEGCEIENPLDPPPIAQEIDIRVIDLLTMRQVGTMHRCHKAYTPNNECFFIFLDVCKEYVASGAENKNGHLWDRHYGTCIAKYPHQDVVNCVAFNPVDNEMLVTASDDNTVKVWLSRHHVAKLKRKS